MDFVIKGPEIDYTPDSRGLGWIYYNCMKQHKNGIVHIDALTGKFDTFHDLLIKSVKTAREMQRRGYEKDDIICICSNNHLNAFVCFIAAQFLGCKVASLDPTLSSWDTKYLLNQVKPKAIFVSSNASDLVKKSAEDVLPDLEIIVFDHEGKTTNGFSAFLAETLSKEDVENFKPVPAGSVKDTAVILFSSGTTGLPKGICVTHYGIAWQSNAAELILSLQNNYLTVHYGDSEGVAKNVLLTFASLYWISTVLVLTTSLLKGFTRLIVPEFNAKTVWNYIEKYQVQTIFMAPCQLLDVMKEKPENADSSSLKALLVGGSSISKEQISRAMSVFEGTCIFQGCGQTEICGAYTCFFPNDPDHKELLQKKPISVGKVMPGFILKVVDPTTEEILGPNQPGELRVKTDCAMNGYYNLDSSSCWDSEGFLKTGDILYFDEDYCFFHVDRIKEMLKYKSWHVAPAFLESVLHEHPAVANAVVVGLPHPEDGDHPLAFVVLHKGNSTPAEEILKFVNDQVHDRQKLRGGLYIIDEFPLTPSGKIQRRELRDRALLMKTY